MIKHIVMWKLLETFEGKNKKETAEAIKEKLMSMNGVVPELNKIEVGINQKESEIAYDVMLYSEFDSWEDLEKYQNDLYHEEVKKFLGLVKKERAVIDYEIDPSKKD